VRLESVLPHDDRLDLETGDELEVVQGPHVRGVGHGNREGPPHLPKGDDPMPHGHLLGDETENLLLDLDLLQIHRRDPELLGQGPSQLVLGDEPQLHQGIPDARLRLAGFPERLLKLLFGNEAFPDEEVAETILDDVCCHR